MEKQKLQKEIEKARAHLTNMEKMLEQCEYERWKPEKHETYYFVNSWGEVEETWRSSINFIPDKNRYNAYNCFETKEQAEQEAEKILVRRMLEDIARRLNNGEEINWGNTKQCKYFIGVQEEYDRILLDTEYEFKNQGVVYCLKVDFLKVAESEIGEERLKKYLRG